MLRIGTAMGVSALVISCMMAFSLSIFMQAFTKYAATFGTILLMFGPASLIQLLLAALAFDVTISTPMIVAIVVMASSMTTTIWQRKHQQ